MSAAWFGLIGVVVGGLITGAVTFLLDHVREQREAERARVIAKSEIAEAGEAVRTAIDSGSWPAGWNTKTWAQSWTTIRSPLASTMDDAAFSAVANAYSFMELLQNGLANGERGFQGNDAQFFGRSKAALEDAKPHLPGSWPEHRSP